MKKKILSLLLTFVILFTFIPFSYAANFTYENKIESMLVAEAKTGKILFKKNIDKPMPIASMSKIMTLLVIKDAIKEGKIKINDIVTVTEDSAKYNMPGYSSFDLVKGEKVSVENLLKASMIVSGNDATAALAIHLSGSEDKFTKLMNDKSKELGLKNSSFINPTGITIEKDKKKLFNKMSAEDLLKLTKYIYEKYPEIEEYGKTGVLDVPERKYSRKSTLPLRDKQSGLLGLKTGYTEEAGYCFTGIFDLSKNEKKLNTKIFTIVMGADTEEMRAVTTDELIDFTLNNFYLSDEINKEKSIADIYVSNSVNKYISAYPQENFDKLVHVGTVIDAQYTLKENIFAPIEDGQIIGEMMLFEDGKEIKKINLINKGYKTRESFISNIINTLKTFFDDLMQFT
ncbi:MULTISPECIES: D-alanyl-D-alanine carboxypeptidase family protein [Helcococcus]|uniref:serine-type D-Ala-D-Ala carboxypeptidase n=1 Tax=Helcococcus bovis TaxID=3153252 RepID=A0ABW9F4H2_9FIRM